MLAMALLIAPCVSLYSRIEQEREEKEKPCWYDCGYWCLYYPCGDVPVRQQADIMDTPLPTPPLETPLPVL